MAFESSEVTKLSLHTLLQISIKNPDFQRCRDYGKVEKIIEYQTENFKKYKSFKFIGIMSLVKFEDNYYLIDGQHRYAAMIKLIKDIPVSVSEECNVEIIEVKTKESMKECYDLINKHTPLPDFDLMISHKNKSIIEVVFNHFRINYPDLWSEKSRCNRPSIYTNSFQESLEYMITKIMLVTSEELIQAIEIYNKNISRYDNLSNILKNISEPMYKKAKKMNFYLGLFPYDTLQEYKFDWVKNIILHINPTAKIKTIRKAKQKISKKLKNTVWEHYFSLQQGEKICPVCNQDKIWMNDFECGHINPESNGGTNDLNNLLPICKGCNSSMGKTHMEDFIKVQFPKNHDAYKNLLQKANEKNLL